jgi:hypothetical protein
VKVDAWATTRPMINISHPQSEFDKKRHVPISPPIRAPGMGTPTPDDPNKRMGGNLWPVDTHWKLPFGAGFRHQHTIHSSKIFTSVFPIFLSGTLCQLEYQIGFVKMGIQKRGPARSRSQFNSLRNRHLSPFGDVLSGVQRTSRGYAFGLGSDQISNADPGHRLTIR